MAVATLNIGSLGGALGLPFWDSFAVILVINVVSNLLPAWTAAFGLTGLRMTTFSYVSTCRKLPAFEALLTYTVATHSVIGETF